jgi:hypothetical protein
MGLVREVNIWKTPSSDRYPEGVRYRLVLVDPTNGRVLLLFDNHWPKGHHFHLRGREEKFRFTSIPEVIVEFRDKSAEEEDRYYESKKNKN